MINEAKKIVKNSKNLFVGSMDDLPFNKNKFDIIVGRFSLHYLKNLNRVYEEFNRVLKKGGSLIIVAHHPLLGFMQLGAKNYILQDNIKMNLYDNNVEINFPHHTIKDYFSETFFKYFTLDYLTEEGTEDAEYPNQWKIPGFIAFRAIKR